MGNAGRRALTEVGDVFSDFVLLLRTSVLGLESRPGQIMQLIQKSL